MEKKALSNRIKEREQKIRGIYDFLNQMIPSGGVAIDPLDLEKLDNNIVALEKGAADLKQVRKELAEDFFEHFTGKKPPQEAQEEEIDETADETYEEYEESRYQQQQYENYDVRNVRDRDHMVMETLRTGFDLIKGIGRLIGMIKDIKNSR